MTGVGLIEVTEAFKMMDEGGKPMTAEQAQIARQVLIRAARETFQRWLKGAAARMEAEVMIEKLRTFDPRVENEEMDDDQI